MTWGYFTMAQHCTKHSANNNAVITNPDAEWNITGDQASHVEQAGLSCEGP